MNKKVKIIRISIVSLMLVLTLLLCTSCKEKGVNVIISDYETQEKIAIVNSIEDEKGVAKLTEGLESGEEITQEISEENAYSVLFEDLKDSKYDIWLKVVIEYDTLYSKYDFEKMDSEYAATLKDMGFSDKYEKSTDITAEEFEEFLQ